MLGFSDWRFTEQWFSVDRLVSIKLIEEILTWKIVLQAWYFARILVQLYSDTAEDISSTMTKVEVAKYIHRQMWILFDIDVENFLSFGYSKFNRKQFTGL